MAKPKYSVASHEFTMMFRQANANVLNRLKVVPVKRHSNHKYLQGLFVIPRERLLDLVEGWATRIGIDVPIIGHCKITADTKFLEVPLAPVRRLHFQEKVENRAPGALGILPLH